MYYHDQQNNISGGYSSVGRALDCGSKGHRFEPYYLPLILQKEFIDKKLIFLYEGYKWDYLIDSVFEVNILDLSKNSNLLCLNYSKVMQNILIIFRETTLFSDKINFENNWYYLYYINSLFKKNLSDNLNLDVFEKYNLITISFKKKQIRLNILSFKNKVLNLTVGRVLASLNILDKSKKKTNKGERLLVEYLVNFFLKTKKFYGNAKLATLKIINGRPNLKVNNNILKLLNKEFKISKLIYDYKIANSFLKLKRMRSIKKRIKKRIIKMENVINL